MGDFSRLCQLLVSVFLLSFESSSLILLVDDIVPIEHRSGLVGRISPYNRAHHSQRGPRIPPRKPLMEDVSQEIDRFQLNVSTVVQLRSFCRMLS